PSSADRALSTLSARVWACTMRRAGAALHTEAHARGAFELARRTSHRRPSVDHVGTGGRLPPPSEVTRQYHLRLAWHRTAGCGDRRDVCALHELLFDSSR